MRLLLLGGSWFLGRLLVEDFAGRGFDVTVFNNRQSAHLSGVRHVRGNREHQDELTALAESGPWDVVVDVSGKIPTVVQRSARAFAGVAARYVSVSTIRVYREWPYAPVHEDSPLWPGDPDYDPGTRIFNPDTYGPLRAGCEIACRDAFGDDRLLIIRLHQMIGQYDYVGPLRAWLERMRRGGPVLVPAPDRSIQPIDVRDVARFMGDQVQLRTSGVFNIAAPTDGRTFSAMLQACAEMTDSNAELVWADGGWLMEHGVEQWTELPLWQHAAATWRVSIDRALAAGLQCRPLAETISDTWHWLNSEAYQPDGRQAQYGMDAAREAALIAQWQWFRRS